MAFCSALSRKQNSRTSKPQVSVLPGREVVAGEGPFWTRFPLGRGAAAHGFLTGRPLPAAGSRFFAGVGTSLHPTSSQVTVRCRVSGLRLSCCQL